jgi:pilus assembly protein CpaB
MRSSGGRRADQAPTSQLVLAARRGTDRARAGWGPALRSRPARRAARRRLAGVALVVASVAGVGHVAREAETARAGWGPVAAVVVAARELPAGARLGPQDLVTRSLPATAVPDGAVTTTGDAVGRHLRTAVPRGEALVGVRLADPATGSTAALLPEGSVALGVTVPTHGPVVAPGDVVDVWAPSESSARRVGTRAVVVAVSGIDDFAGGRGVTLAVATEDAAGVAAASLSGPVALAIVP